MMTPFDDFSVFITHRKPESGHPITDPDEISDRLMDELAGHHGVVTVGPDVWDAVVSVTAPFVSDALDKGSQVVTAAGLNAGLCGWTVVDIRAVRGDVLDEENSRPVRAST